MSSTGHTQTQLNSDLAIKANTADVTKIADKLFTEVAAGTDGRTLFPTTYGTTIYRCVTAVNAPKTNDEGYIIVVYRDWDFIVQTWYSLWYDDIYYNRCHINNGWKWSGYKKITLTSI